MLQVLEKIRPTDTEKLRLSEVTEELLELIEDRTREVDQRIFARLLGSTSRDTWLSMEKDLDIFVFFPVEYKKSALEKAVTDLGRDILEKTEKRYAEHPYIKGRYKDFEVEFVPCYQVDDARNIKSSVDRTPFHDAFVRKHVGEREDEVRLLKQFLKGTGLYGAEARVEGFSGYLCELLVIYYGTFQGVLEGAIGWRPGAVITLEGSRDEEGLRKKFPSPLILMDPVDEKRNVASALSQTNFSIFIYAAKSYLEGPREEFFFPKDEVVEKDDLKALYRERGMDLIGLVFRVPDIVDDILYPQMRKARGVLEALLNYHGFKVVKSDFIVADRAVILFELQAANLPGAVLHQGPEVNTEHEARFLQKYKDNPKCLTAPFIRKDRWYVFLKRKFTRGDVLLERFFSKRDLMKKGVPKYVTKSITENGLVVKTGEDLFEEDLLPGLKEFLDPRFPWER